MLKEETNFIESEPEICDICNKPVLQAQIIELPFHVITRCEKHKLNKKEIGDISNILSIDTNSPKLTKAFKAKSRI